MLSRKAVSNSLRDEKIRLVDLNRDELIRTPLRASYMDAKDLWLLTAHLSWTSRSSQKNTFGVGPGARYRWPKNILHWKGGIQESILDLCATVPIRVIIADGIVAMEGNGRLNDTPLVLWERLVEDDPVTADATCARLMAKTSIRSKNCQHSHSLRLLTG